MATAHRHPLIATRASPETKARFATLAASRGLSESALLALLVGTVLEDNVSDASRRAVETSEPCSERITLRLRPGDRALVDSRAAARRMKPASYLVALIRAHVRGSAPIPVAELNTLKTMVNQLSAVTRELREVACSPSTSGISTDLARLLTETRAKAEDARRDIAEVVRTNLLSWETDDV